MNHCDEIVDHWDWMYIHCDRIGQQVILMGDMVIVIGQ